MDEQTRNEIVRQHRGGASLRAIARKLHLARRTVRKVIEETEQARGQGAEPAPPPRRRRPSKLDAFEQTIKDLLARYPNITAVRVHEELSAQGFTGGMSIVRQRVRALRPSRSRQLVVRFETAPGAQAQMDYATYTIDFTVEGRRRVHLFGYILGYSRRRYLRFVEHQDFETTLRQHIHAFEHLGGVAATCLYDNMKVVVIRWEDGEPIYNPRFLAFATHYGYKPWACRPRRPETKGKIEKSMAQAESSLLNGRSFRSLEHLNEVTAWWLANVADVRVHRTTGARPIDRHAEELPHLLPLPERPFDPSPVVYRVVDVEGLVGWRRNRYSVPWHYVGQTLPVRITETELVAYSPQVEEIARHPLFPSERSGQIHQLAEHLPHREARVREEQLRRRFAELGECAVRFLDGLLTMRRYGKGEAARVLALLGTYSRADLLRALERAVCYGAFSLRAVERILAAIATPRSLPGMTDDQLRTHLGSLTGDPVGPRPTTEYQSLLDDEENRNGQKEERPGSDEGDRADVPEDPR